MQLLRETVIIRKYLLIIKFRCILANISYHKESDYLAPIHNSS